MRLVLVSVGVIVLLAIESAYGQPCDGYPASKTWTAGGSNMIHESDGGSYPGWEKEFEDWGSYYYQNHPVTVDGLTAQTDRIQPMWPGWWLKLRYTTEDSGWTVTGGDELSICWKLHVSEPGTQYPKIQAGLPRIRLRNGVGMLELAFEENVTGVDGCTLSGWMASQGTITDGGREMPNQLSPADRYLPMGANEWHMIRVDLHADGSFDAWIDDGGSDWKHASGTTPPTSNTYIRFGQIDTSCVTHEFSTACVAWGEGAGEIPPAPPGAEEICENELDDDGDGDIDCDDSDCDCSPIADECTLFVDMIEHFNVEFVEPDEPPTDDFTIPPGWAHFGYGAPLRANPETGLFKLPPYPETGPSASQRLRIAFDLIPTECGTGPDCYDGVFGLEKNMTANELVTLPIDWTQPVKITMESNGSDLTTDGQWQSFLTFDGYAGTGGEDISYFEWGNDGHPHTGSKAGFLTHTYTLDPGQKDVTGTFLRFGIDFDLWDEEAIPPGPIDLPDDKTNISFFENVRIIYTYDPTAPILALDTSAIDHNIFCGDTLPDDAFTVTNEGGTTLTYTISDDADWLSVTPESGGPLSTGQSDPITVMYDVEGLAGTYTATITVSSPEAFWSPETITVTLTVVCEQIELSETAFTHDEVLAGTSPSNDMFTVTNSGAGAMTYSINDGGTAWLTELPDAGGPLGAGESDPITVSYDTAGLPVNDYTATITVSSPEADNSPQIITVNVTIVLTPPDYDCDGDVDQSDFGIFQNCITGDRQVPDPPPPPTPGLCADYADLDGDGDVDQSDVTKFEGCASGPEVPFSPDCLTP